MLYNKYRTIKYIFILSFHSYTYEYLINILYFMSENFLVYYLYTYSSDLILYSSDPNKSKDLRIYEKKQYL